MGGTLRNFSLTIRAAHPKVCTMHQREHLPVVAAAQRIGTSRWTVQRLIRSGKLNATRIANTYVIDSADLDAYLAQNEVSS